MHRDPPPNYTIRETTVAEVKDLFARFHAYKSTGRVCTYAFAVIEDDKPVAAFLWQPPPPNAAKVVCPELQVGVLSLSRMVATPREERRLQHISKPLKHQMKHLIDRTRWPVLVTYSDESVGHTGHVYKCSGWKKTARNATTMYTVGDQRVSRYSNGVTTKPENAIASSAWIQRWEHRIAQDPVELVALFSKHWDRVPVRARDGTPKLWRSGAQAYTYQRRQQPLQEAA